MLFRSEDYHMMRERYLSDKASLQKRLDVLLEEQRKMDRDIAMFLEMESDLSRFLNEHTNHADLIDKFVEKVYVSGTERMEIRFYCDDIFRRVCAATKRREEG